MTSLDQLPPLQQVSKDELPGGMLPEMQAWEGEMQGRLDAPEALADASAVTPQSDPAQQGPDVSTGAEGETSALSGLTIDSELSAAAEPGAEDAVQCVARDDVPEDDVTRNQPINDSNDESPSTK